MKFLRVKKHPPRTIYRDAYKCLLIVARYPECYNNFGVLLEQVLLSPSAAYRKRLSSHASFMADFRVRAYVPGLSLIYFVSYFLHFAYKFELPVSEVENRF